MKQLLIEVKSVIEKLRRENELLNAKVEVMELFACTLHTQASTRNLGAEIDVVWQIQQKIDELERSQTK